MSDLERIPTHIEGLDEKMQGGIPQGHICIVAGASGAMKSSLTFSMLYNAVLYGETSGIYVTLEQGKDSLRSHMANMGMNVDDPRVRNRIAIIDLANKPANTPDDCCTLCSGTSGCNAFTWDQYSTTGAKARHLDETNACGLGDVSHADHGCWKRLRH